MTARAFPTLVEHDPVDLFPADRRGISNEFFRDASEAAGPVADNVTPMLMSACAVAANRGSANDNTNASARASL